MSERSPLRALTLFGAGAALSAGLIVAGLVAWPHLKGAGAMPTPGLSADPEPSPEDAAARRKARQDAANDEALRRAGERLSRQAAEQLRRQAAPPPDAPEPSPE